MTMALLVRAVLAAVMVLISARGVEAQAQTAPDVMGQTVASLRFEVEGRPDTSQTLLDLSAVRVGQPLRLEDTRSTIARLDGLDRYDGIAVEAFVVAGGVDVLFRLTPRHPITAMELVGDTGISPGDLRRQLQQRYGGVPTSARIPAIEATATQFLRDEGYLQARVNGRTELAHNPEAATLILDVQAGPQSLISNVSVQGVSPLTPDTIVRRSRTGVGQPYRPREIEAALAGIEEDLRARGYYEAQLTMQPTAPSPEGVDIAIMVAAGPRVELRVTPEGVLPGRLDELVPLRRAGSADQDLLEDSRARIERALRADGYWRASAPFTRSSEQDGALVVITFTIDRGPRYYVERVELTASQALPASEVRKFIGLDRGDVFDEDAFLAGLVRVADAYRLAGYYAVRAEPTYQEVTGSAARASLILHPTITEGPVGRVTALNFEIEGAPIVTRDELLDAMSSRTGQPYVEQTVALDQQAIRTLYLDRGFPTSAVAIVPMFSDDGRDVTLNVRVNEGPRLLIGDISVVGNERVSTRAIIDEMGLVAGQPAGTTALDEARRKLVEMGVFRRITISMADRSSDGTTGHLIVNVVEAPATTVDIGGGLEGSRYTRDLTDRLEFAPRGFLGISRRGLGGRNRAVSLFSRVALKRGDRVEGDSGAETAEFGFVEYRVAGTYQERRAFGSNTDLLFGVASEQARRTNFDFVRQRVNAEGLRVLTPRTSLSGRYSLEFTDLAINEVISENDRPLIDRLFPQVRLSILSSGFSWDRRDNLIDPTRGTFVTADIESATRMLGSEVGYVKGFFQASAFRRLDPAARTVLAGRVMMGAARGFERVVEIPDENGVIVEQVVEDLPASQRFYAGGATTVRGFQLDRLGVDEILTADGLSRGGNGLIVLNAEARRVLTRLFSRDFGVVAFIDAGNVFGRAGDVAFDRLRVAPGFGIRYDSPLGPLRLDFGFKLSPKTFTGRPEKGWEYHLSIGEAF